MLNNNFKPVLATGPGFCRDAYPPELLDVATGVQNITHGPGAMIAELIIAALATTFQGMADVEGLNGNPIPLSVYLLAAVASGEGKTSTLKTVFEPITNYSRKIAGIATDLKGDYRDKYDSWKYIMTHLNRNMAARIGRNEDISEIAEGIAKHQEKRPVSPRNSSIISDDITPAGLKNKFRNSYPFGVVASSDGGHVLNKDIMNSMPFYSSLWSGEDINNARADDSFSIQEPRLSMVILTQESYFDNFVLEKGDEFRNSGLSGRFLVVRPFSNVGNRPIGNQIDDYDTAALESYRTKLTNALSMQLGDGQQPIPERRVIRLSQEAKNFLQTEARNIEYQMGHTGAYFYIRELASKFIEYTCRISAIYELYQDLYCTEVGLANARRAFSLMSMNLKQYVDIFATRHIPTQMMLDANELLSWFVRVSNCYTRPVGHRELMQNGPYMLRSKKHLEPLLSILQSNWRINTVKLPGALSGRLRTCYQVVNGTPLEQNAI